MEKLTQEQFMKIKKWMYRNARPLDIARWKYNFEDGSKEEVLKALAAYQNLDGGFGHALEADSWNPNSCPIQTWRATEILYELGVTDKENEIVKGILAYLDSKKDFQDGYWLTAVPTNNDYPHAPWWSYGDNVIENLGYNPTISLVGFVLYFADKESKLYKLAHEIARKAVEVFLQEGYPVEMHEIPCFIRFYEYCTKARVTDIFDADKMKNSLKKAVKSLIEEDTESWKNDYVCKPSRFMITPDSMFYPDNKKVSDYEAEFIVETMNPDGTWNVPWNWSNYLKEWELSKNWWKANVILLNLRYIKGFEMGLL